MWRWQLMYLYIKTKYIYLCRWSIDFLMFETSAVPSSGTCTPFLFHICGNTWPMGRQAGGTCHGFTLEHVWGAQFPLETTTGESRKYQPCHDERFPFFLQNKKTANNWKRKNIFNKNGKCNAIYKVRMETSFCQKKKIFRLNFETKC